MNFFQKYASYLWPIFGFVLVALFYFYPVLKGEKIYQSDIVQYTGMAKEQNDFRQNFNEEPYWTNSAFGGMPTYQLGAKYPYDFIGHLDDIIRFLPRPADYLFLYFLSFYVLLLVLKIDPLKAFFGALAFGFSTYLIIILGVGHNAKAHAIGYMPLVLAGVLLVFQKRFIVGGLLTMIAVALELNANHFQMTYYLFLLLLIIGIGYSIIWIKNKAFADLGKALLVLLGAAIFALGANATNLLATSEYAKFSTRSDSELTYEPDGKKKTNTNAMSYDYITEYSYGVAESLNLIAPRLFGGSNAENVGKNSEMYEYIQNQGATEEEAASFVKELPMYWGAQPIVAAPAYIGIVVFFLALMGIFTEKRPIKWVLVIGALFSLFLSWGKNFALLTDFFINHVPLYNKFRAVSSIQVLLELCLPALAVLGLYNFYKLEIDAKKKLLKTTGILTIGILLLLLICKSNFNFSSNSDEMYAKAYGEEFVRIFKEDRATLYTKDVLRSLVYVLAVLGLFWGVIKNWLQEKTSVLLIGILMVFDLFTIAKNYVNQEDFKPKSTVDMPFEMTEGDQQIAEDTTHFRVYDVSGGMNSARASYFHKSIGGYSAVKPKKIQELFDYQVSNNNLRIFNMLNVKYILREDEQGEMIPLQNPGALGNAWFVSKIKTVKNADEEMKALDSLDVANVAVFNQSSNKGKYQKNLDIAKDSTATVSLTSYKANHLKYESNNSKNGFAVFSEIYYPNGWNATIDGKEAKIYNVNYVLRGLEIPAGKHKIEFKFEPQVVQTGSTITLISSMGILLLIGVGVYFEKKRINFSKT